MPVRRVVAASLAMLHLVLVAIFVWSGFPGDRSGAFFDAARTYRNLAGIFRDYTFFAPAVANDAKAGFLVERTDGTSRFIEFTARNGELAFRYNCILESSLRDERAIDLLAQSWAAAVLGADPGAERVSVLAMVHAVPTIAAFRAGERPQWHPAYAAVFERTDAEGHMPGRVDPPPSRGGMHDDR